MIFKTIKVEGIGEVPIIGEVNSSTRRVIYYTENQPKQAQKPNLSDKNEDFKPVVPSFKAVNNNQQSLL